ncbi:MAG: helix-turn-helix transcriptional regulator, partial [Gaiellaceae bacterium]
LRAGHREEAEAALAVLERQADRADRPWRRAVAARCRGLLVADDRFEAEFEESLAHHDRTPMPFERARTELCLGERRRRAGRRVDARKPLRSALSTFEALGAAPWAERARAELRASGETVTRHDPTGAERLTPQELQVALVVARGATNKEAAAELFLSPKTIDFHLRNVYRKLGVRSRTELAHRLRSEKPGDDAPHVAVQGL